MYAERLIENVTEGFLSSINASFADVAANVDLLISCTSPRGDSTNANDADCPVDSARELLDDAQAELDSQLALAREGFQDYADAFETYYASATAAYENIKTFYDGAMSYLDSSLVDLEDIGAWAQMNWYDFSIEEVTVPDGYGILTDYLSVATASDIWEETRQAYDNFTDSLASVAANVSALAEAWEEAATELLSNISFTFQLDDYDPPRYANGSSHVESDAHLESAVSIFAEYASTYSAEALALLGTLRPQAPNLSFPGSQSLNYTFEVDESTTVFRSLWIYGFEAFPKDGVIFGSWTVSASALGVLLLTADYFFRCSSSIRLLIRFWGRAGVGLPDADLRADKPIFGKRGIVADLRTALLRVILHPATTVLFFSAVSGFLVYHIASLYLPLYHDYRAGCVDHTQPGSFMTQVAFAVAYNYAAEGGNADTWAFQVRNSILGVGEVRKTRREGGVDEDWVHSTLPALFGINDTLACSVHQM